MRACVRSLTVGLLVMAPCATLRLTAAPVPKAANEAVEPDRDSAAHPTSMPVDRVAAMIDWLPSSHPYGGACLRIRAHAVIYIDPASLAERDTSPPADIVLVTHGHDDHCSPAILAKLRKPATRIVTTADCARQLPADWRATLVGPGDRLTVSGVGIEAVPAYSVGSQAHPRDAGGVGYVLTLGGVRVYHTGDTTLTPEMSAIGSVDILVADLRKPYQMSAEEIVEAARILKPSLVIPVHWLEAERPEAARVRDGVPAGMKVLLRSTGGRRSTNDGR